MDKRVLKTTTSAFSGLLDAHGRPIPVTPKVDILKLPQIDRRDFPDVPDDMEMRLLTPANGAEPSIVLFHPDTTLHLEFPVPAAFGGLLSGYVIELRTAVERLSMGVMPDGE